MKGFVSDIVEKIQQTEAKSYVDFLITKQIEKFFTVMTTIPENFNQLKKNFLSFQTPRDKYVYLVDLAKNSEGLSAENQCEKNRIHGCTSQAWVTREMRQDNFFFKPIPML